MSHVWMDGINRYMRPCPQSALMSHHHDVVNDESGQHPGGRGAMDEYKKGAKLEDA